MRLIKLLTVSAILSACAGLPTPPTGKLYLHFGDSALCSDIQTGDACPKVPMSQTEKYVMLEPQTWANIQNYIDALLRALQQKGSPGFLSSERDEQLNALYRIKFAMRSAEQNWRKRR